MVPEGPRCSLRDPRIFFGGLSGQTKSLPLGRASFFMNSKNVWVSLAGISALVFAGCASSSSSRPVYSSSQVGQVITQDTGEIIGVQDVLIQGQTSQAGSAGVGSRMGSAVATSAILGSPIHAAVAAGQMIGGIAGAGADNKNG